MTSDARLQRGVIDATSDTATANKKFFEAIQSFVDSNTAANKSAVEALTSIVATAQALVGAIQREGAAKEAFFNNIGRT